MEVLETDGSVITSTPTANLTIRPMRRAGLRILFPGWPQWRWGQNGRGIVLFGSFISAVATAAFAWGTLSGLALLLFAYFVHLTSLADALRQSAFPALRPRVAFVAASAVLGLGVYAPILWVASVWAWPSVGEHAHSEAYLVDRWGFRWADPRREDFVWFRSSPFCEPRLGRVVAGSGQEVVWEGNQLRVDGLVVRGIGVPFRSVWPPREVACKVPDRHLLVIPDASPTNHKAPEGLMIVARDQVLGRAWAQFYPVRERRLL